METTGFINTTKKVYPAVTYSFQVQNIPSNWNVTNIIWTVGPNADIFVNGINRGFTFQGQNLTQIDVKFEDICTIGLQYVEVEIEGTDTKGTSTELDDEPIEFQDDKKDLKLKAISTPSISGPLQVQECCLDPLNYSLSGYCDADKFDWTLPGGWIKNQQSDSPPTPYVNVTPSNQTGGALQVTATLKDHPIPGAYEKTASINISRYTPQINFIDPPQRRICPFDVITLQYELICGAQEYVATLPTGWTLISQSILDENVGQLRFTASTGDIPGSNEEPIELTAYFNGRPAVSAQLNLMYYTDPPTATPAFEHHGMYTWYHCGKWQICPNRTGRLTMDHVTDLNAQSIEYEMTGNYVFSNGLQSISKELPLNQNPATFIPFIDITPTTSISPGPGQIRARFVNCLPGTGPWGDWMDFYQEEEPEWCYEQYPYPDWCSCCEPGEDGNVIPKSALIKIDTTNGKDVVFKIYPNPASALLTVQNITGISYSYEIFTTANHLVASGEKVTALEYKIDISLLAPGPYYLVLTDTETNETHRFKVLKQ